MDNLKIILDACLRVYGADFTVNNRKRENVYAKAAFYNVCKKNTKATLEAIGKMVGRDHATVLYGYNKTIKEKDGSFLLIPDFRFILHQFETIVNGLVDLKTEPEIEDYYKDLINKIESLENENKELRKELYKLKTIEAAIEKESILDSIINKIKGLTDETLEDLDQYRINPYLKLQESKVTYKHLN